MTLVCISMGVLGQKPIGEFRCGHGSHHQMESHKKASGDFDVLEYQINLSVDLAQQRIDGYTDVNVKAVESIQAIDLSLEGLKVDSVTQNGQSLSYTHSANQLKIDLSSTLNKDDESTIRVYYGGKPIRDASWGGFYFSGEYAFNLGVAFTSAPHNFGRVWFPCVDNFTDRATYTFAITCSEDKTAMCNGILTNEVNNNDGTKTYSWEMNEPIPTYLASIAVAPYTFSQWLHESGIPVVLSAVKADSLKMIQSFKNLDKCIEGFLTQYGPHTFDRIGFNLVPFNGGAMEHATNIAYPRFGATGDLAFETLYAHELAHHWWGNTVTCRTAEDMWINEGWASFSERVFLEFVYGRDRYDDDISSNHRAVLHYAHLRDGDTLPVSGIGHENTYGMHVYDKGADMVHTLRGYMGDEDFFKAVKSFMVDYKFKDVSSQDLEDHFQKFTNADLSKFFDNWIYSPGFPHFEILSQKVSQDGDMYKTELDIRQRLRLAPNYFEKVPLSISLFSANHQSDTFIEEVGGERTTLTFRTTEKPVYVALDFFKRISDAITDDYAYIKDTGDVDMGDAMMNLNVKQVGGEALVRIEHNWVGADAYFVTDTTPFISRERYWNVDGIWDEKFNADATVEYFGRETGTNYAAGYLDVDLIRNTEENMVLMYRPNASTNWEVYPDYTWSMGSKFDKRGAFTIHNLKKGQYCFGIRDAARLSSPVPAVDSRKYVSVYPNPADKVLNVNVDKAKNATLEITDMAGKLMYTDRVTSKKCCKPVDVSGWAPGVYNIGVVIDGQPYSPVRVLVK